MLLKRPLVAHLEESYQKHYKEGDLGLKTALVSENAKIGLRFLLFGLVTHLHKYYEISDNNIISSRKSYTGLGL